MDLRDEFAMRVVEHLAALESTHNVSDAARVAVRAYRLADALMAERERSRKEEKGG